jgi:serine acetyltransferase
MQAYGYNHIVHIRDACSVGAVCVVTTDVNPEPTSVAVAAKSETEVNTYLGSPSRVFTPKITCTMR